MRTSTLSRVVPGTSETITRSAPARLLMKVLLPALRRPTVAIISAASGGAVSPVSGGNFAAMASNSSSLPSFWSALTHSGSPYPSLWNSPACCASFSVSALLATSTTGLFTARSRTATSSSRGTTPSRTSTMNTIIAADSSAS